MRRLIFLLVVLQAYDPCCCLESVCGVCAEALNAGLLSQGTAQHSNLILVRTVLQFREETCEQTAKMYSQNAVSKFTRLPQLTKHL